MAFAAAGAAAFLTFFNSGKPWLEAAYDGLSFGMLGGIALTLIHVFERVRGKGKARDPKDAGDSMTSGGLTILFVYLVIIAIIVAVRAATGSLPGAAGQRSGTEADFSYGPADANGLHLILAPGVSAAILPSAASLGTRRFEEFDISPEGSVVVRDENRLFDMASGREIAEVPGGIHSFAFFGGALTIVTRDGTLGYLDGGSFHATGPAPAPDTHLTASSDRSRLMLFRWRADPSGATPAIVSLTAGGGAAAVSGSTNGTGAVGADAIQTYFSQGRSFYLLTAPARPQRLFIMPEGNPILGILVSGQSVYFSTQRGVYILSDGMALPLVLGIGGALRSHGADLYLLDHSHGRIFRISPNGGTRS